MKEEKQERKEKALLKNTCIKRSKFSLPYVDDTLNDYEINEFKSKNKIYIDPGKNSLLMMMEV